MANRRDSSLIARWMVQIKAQHWSLGVLDYKFNVGTKETRLQVSKTWPRFYRSIIVAFIIKVADLWNSLRDYSTFSPALYLSQVVFSS